MTTTIFPAQTLGKVDHGWLKARHHFSFASYHNPARMGFGTLRVINDDTVEAGRGFAPHPHRDMEIITYVRSGAITHEDSLGNKGRTAAGDVQVMSAGSGVTHSEWNHEDVNTTLFQIWIHSREKGVAPRWDARSFPKAPVVDTLPLLVSGRTEDEGKGALFIHQDAAIYGGVLAAGAKLTHPIKHQAYVLASRGSLTLNGKAMHAGDGAEIVSENTITLATDAEAEVLIIDAPIAANG